MNRLKDCCLPTNQLGEEERSVSRGSTQAKCYGWLGKYIIRQKGINTITSIYLSETLIWINFNQNYCFCCTENQGQYLVELEWHWHETILETIIKKHQPNSHHRNPDQLIFQILGVTLPKIHYRHREFLSELKNIHNLFLLNLRVECKTSHNMISDPIIFLKICNLISSRS